MISPRSPEASPLKLGPDKVTIRNPYGQRFTGLRRFELLERPMIIPVPDHVTPYIPESLYTEADFLLSDDDKQRMNGMKDYHADPVKDYWSHPKTQVALLAEEHAAARIMVEKPETYKALEARHRIGRLVHTTSLLDGSGIVKTPNGHVLFKSENLQRQGSFKVRGAANAMFKLKEERALRGNAFDTVVTVSAGNHAQGVALAAGELGVQSVIFMSGNASPLKIAQVRELGAHVILAGNTFNCATVACQEFQQHHRDVPYIAPYDNYDVMNGQGSIAVEVLQQTERVDGLVAAVGGGGLISVNAAVIKENNPDAEVIGAVLEFSEAARLSLAAGQVVSIKTANPWCDGTTVKAPGEKPFEYMKRYVDRIKVMRRGQVEQAMVDYYQAFGTVIEPAAGLVLAALQDEKASLKGNYVGILGGSNIEEATVKTLQRRLSGTAS